jgi:hypothetical protein
MAQLALADGFETARSEWIDGARLVVVQRHTDERGCLIALDRDQSLPFDPRRVYCIYQGSTGAVRGEHAISAHCAFVALQGGVTVDLDNGQEQASIRLSTPDRALCIHAGVWLRIRDLTGGTIVLVAASRAYGQCQYYDRPNRNLLVSFAQDSWL